MASSVAADTVVYFVTGANRGLGLGLVSALAARANTLVYATARDPSGADKLQQLSQQRGNVRIVRLHADSDADHQAVAKQLQAEAGRVDVVIASAGISKADAYERVEKLSLDKLREHFEVNAVGPMRLFGALYPLLCASSTPVFAVISSYSGSIAYQPKFPTFYTGNYGASKAAVNYLVQRVHVEHPNISAFPVHPGWVQTDMGNAGAAVAGMKQAPMSVEQSVSGILGVLDQSTRATHSGKFWSAEDGSELPW